MSVNNEQYPEHAKLQKVQEKSQAIGEFIEWLRQSKKIVFCLHRDDLPTGTIVEPENEYIPEWMPTTIRIEETLAEYFKIDLNKLEAEKRAMLDEVRQYHKIGADKR